MLSGITFAIILCYFNLWVFRRTSEVGLALYIIALLIWAKKQNYNTIATARRHKAKNILKFTLNKLDISV